MTEQLLNGKSGKVRTVRGMIEPEDLKTTYVHEHLYVVPNMLEKYYDYTFDDIDKSIEEVEDFMSAGGKSLVDLTPINYGRNPIALEKISEKTGANVMFVTGFHKEEFLPSWIDDLTDQEIYQELVREVTRGVSSHFLFPNLIKIGTSYNEITEKEKRIIDIVSQVHKDTKIPIISHCDKGTMGLEQIDLLEKNQVDISKVCLSHVDLSMDLDYMSEICERGAMISFDHVGRQPLEDDIDKIKILKALIDRGYIDHITISGDMGRKKYFKSYGGLPGLSYILTDFKEKFVEIIDLDSFNKIMEDNTKKYLAW